ncbi:MAG: hypothetical protein ABI642_07795 [Polaromonas sp.]
MLAALTEQRRVSQRKGSLRYNKKMCKSLATLSFPAALPAGCGAPVFAQITKTTTIKG